MDIIILGMASRTRQCYGLRRLTTIFMVVLSEMKDVDRSLIQCRDGVSNCVEVDGTVVCVIKIKYQPWHQLPRNSKRHPDITLKDETAEAAGTRIKDGHRHTFPFLPPRRPPNSHLRWRRRLPEISTLLSPHQASPSHDDLTHYHIVPNIVQPRRHPCKQAPTQPSAV